MEQGHQNSESTEHKPHLDLHQPHLEIQRQLSPKDEIALIESTTPPTQAHPTVDLQVINEEKGAEGEDARPLTPLSISDTSTSPQNEEQLLKRQVNETSQSNQEQEEMQNKAKNFQDQSGALKDIPMHQRNFKRHKKNFQAYNEENAYAPDDGDDEDDDDDDNGAQINTQGLTHNTESQQLGEVQPIIDPQEDRYADDEGGERVEEEQADKEKPNQNNQKDNLLGSSLQSEGKLTFQQALQRVGGENRYQRLALLIFVFAWLIGAMLLLSPVFLFATPKFDCTGMPNFSGTDMSAQDACKAQVCALDEEKQRERVYFGNSRADTHNPFTKQFSLYCAREGQATLLAGSLYLGCFIAFLLVPLLTDGFARRRTIMFSGALCTLGCLLMTIANSFEMMLIATALAGFAINTVLAVTKTLINEQTIGRFREYSLATLSTSFGIGELIFVLAAYHIQDWRSLCLLLFLIPTILLSAAMSFLYESPSYLYERDLQNAIVVLNQIAKVNGKQRIDEKELQQAHDIDNTYSLLDLFRYNSLRLTTYLVSIVFFSVEGSLYCINFAMNSVGLNLYTNILIVAAADTLAQLFSAMLVPKVQRRRAMLLGLLLSAAIAFMFAFLQLPIQCKKDEVLCMQKLFQLLLVGALRFFVCIVWQFAYVLVSEFFPKVVRQLALSFTSALGALGSFSSPFIVAASLTTKNFLPMYAVGTLCLLGALHVCPTRETKNEALQDTIYELAELHSPNSVADGTRVDGKRPLEVSSPTKCNTVNQL